MFRHLRDAQAAIINGTPTHLQFRNRNIYTPLHRFSTMTMQTRDDKRTQKAAAAKLAAVLFGIGILIAAAVFVIGIVFARMGF